MSTFRVTVYGTPQPGGSKVRNRYGGVRDANPKAKGWKDQVAQVAGEAMAGRPLLPGPLSATFTFWRARPKGHLGKRGLRPSAPAFPTTRPDALKLSRLVEDALSGVVYTDDAQIVDETLKKRYGSPERVDIEIEEMLG